jgi:ribosomal protein S18 acetylase RimI-like enzyme
MEVKHMQIRIATKKDYNIINSMLIKLHEYHVKNDPSTFVSIETFFTKKEYYKRIKNKHIYYIAEENNIPMGIIGINSCNNDFINLLFVNSLYVEEKYRNLGIATKLFEEVIKYYNENCQTNKWCDYLNLNVSSFNTSAIKLYEKLNFKFQSHNMGLKLK